MTSTFKRRHRDFDKLRQPNPSLFDYDGTHWDCPVQLLCVQKYTRKDDLTEIAWHHLSVKTDINMLQIFLLHSDNFVTVSFFANDDISIILWRKDICKGHLIRSSNTNNGTG